MTNMFPVSLADKNNSPIFTLHMNISPKYDANENIERNIFFNNNLLIKHLLAVKLNFDEIKPASCAPTIYDSFIWFHDCEI